MKQLRQVACSTAGGPASEGPRKFPAECAAPQPSLIICDWMVKANPASFVSADSLYAEMGITQEDPDAIGEVDIE